ncbi:MAG: hypothetical protein ACR2H4_03420 [Pyrinomonadaceae bacterium]
MPVRFCVWAIIGTRKLSDVPEGGRDAVLFWLSRWLSALQSNTPGSGRNCGPTLFEAHNEMSAAMTRNARISKSLDMFA